METTISINVIVDCFFFLQYIFSIPAVQIVIACAALLVVAVAVIYVLCAAMMALGKFLHDTAVQMMSFFSRNSEHDSIGPEIQNSISHEAVSRAIAADFTSTTRDNPPAFSPALFPPTQNMTNQTNHKVLSELGVDIDHNDFPSRYIDFVTLEVMNDPIIVNKEGDTLDKQSYIELIRYYENNMGSSANNLHPGSRRPMYLKLSETKPNIALQAEIKALIEEQRLKHTDGMQSTFA